jgi:hypothetical protein
VGRARTHPFYSGIYLNNPPENVEGNFAYDYYRYYFDGADVGNADVNAVSIMATYSGYEYRPGHFAALDYPPVARTVGSFLAPTLIGEFRENTSYHIIHELIKPIVDSGNTTLLPYLDIRTDRGPNPYSAHYYKNGNYYFVSNLFVQVMDNVVAGVGAVSSGHPELYNYFLQPIDQQYYLKGDFNQSGMIGGNVSGGYHYWSTVAGFASNSWPETSNVYGGYGNTDVEIALMSYNDELSETTGYPGYRSGAFYSNVQIALNEMYNDSVLNEYVQIVSASSTSNTTLTYPNAVAITNLEYESSLNEEKRTIKVLRPKYLSSFLAEFEALLNG